MEDEEFQIIEAPDGTELEFPADMSMDEISAVMAQRYPRPTPGIGVTPAPADNPAARTGDVLQQADQFVDETQRIEGRAMQRDIERAGSDMQVVRHPQTGEPYQRAFLSDPAVARGPGFEQLQDSSELAQGAAAINGNFLGAGGELAGLMNPDLPFAKQGFDEAYARAYEENPALAMALEMGGSAGPLMLGGAVGMGPRTAGAVEGGVYGFNDPFVGGEGLESRALNAAGGALTGRVLGGIGAGSKNQLDRQINTWSGVDTIQRVADEDFGITLTEGQITKDPKLRALEDSAKKGSLGSESANRAGREAFQTQNEAATRAARALGGDTFTEANQAAEAAARGIRSRIDQRRGEITEAYDRAASYGATMSEDGIKGLPKSIIGRMRNADVERISEIEEGITDPSLFPAFKSVVASTRRMSEKAAARGEPIPFQAIEDHRKTINEFINSANKNPEDKAAVVRFKKAFDEAIDAAVDDGLFNGDQAFISAFREARELNAKFHREWGANKVFEKIVDREARPEEVINFILGGSRVAGDKNYDVLLQLKGALEEDPEAWQALQEAYVKKTFNQLPKDFGPQRTLQLLDEMLVGRNQSFSQILFDDDQYQQMRRFRSVVESMVPPDGAINYSNSGILLQRMQTSANDMMTGLHATPGVRMIGRTIMGTLDKFGVETQGRRVKRQLNPPRGLDTRRIEEGFPEQRFTPRAVDLPGAGAGVPRQPRSLQEGIEQASRGEPTTTQPSPMAEAMNGPQVAPQRPVFGRRAPEPEVPPQAPPGPPSRVTEPIPESAYGGGPRNAERMNIPKEPTTLTSAVRNLGGIKTRYTSEGVQKNLSRGEFEGIPGLINDRAGKGADDMVRALQEDGFDIASEDDLYRALDNERMGVKTYRIGEGEAYEMELDAYEALARGDVEPDDPVQMGLPAFDRTKPGRKVEMPAQGSQGSGIQMQLKDGTPTTIGKIYELATSINPETNKPWTRAEIADEMMISKNQVSVTYHKLRKNGYSVDVVPSVSAVGARGEKGQMMLQLKRQGLSNREIANRVNMIYGKDAVHGGTDTNAAAVGVTLSKLRSKMRGNGEVVDFGMGLALPSAAASMMLTEGESSEEEMMNLLGTEEEKRAAMARAMLGGY